MFIESVSNVPLAPVGVVPVSLVLSSLYRDIAQLVQLCRKSLAPIVAQILEWEFAFLAAAAGKSDQRKLLACQLLRQIAAQDCRGKRD